MTSEQAIRLCEACERFEWETIRGGLPRIEKYLERAPAEDRPQLLEDLLGIELERRIGARETPHPEDYAARFPDHRDLIELLIHKARAEVPEPRQSVGPYVLLEEIGRGRQGVVYRARKAGPANHDVALKVMTAGMIGSRDAAVRFVNSIQRHAGVHHPHIVPYLDSGDDCGRLYYVMRLMPLTLAKRAGPMDPVEAVELMIKLVEAVHHLHSEPVPILHNDLKPGNILLDDKGEPYIADFGLAVLLDGEGELDGVVGTVPYIAPEKLDHRFGEVGPASDIYSLGVIFYELLTGRLPFPHAHGSILATIEREPIPPGRIQKGIPTNLESVCLRCLCKKTETRYASADELLMHLRACRLGEGPIPPERFLPRLLDWARREPALAARVIVIILASGIIWGGRLIMGRYAVLAPDHWAQDPVTRWLLSPFGSAERALVWLTQLTLVAWALASWGFQRQLNRWHNEGGLQLGWRAVDVTAISLIILFDDALMSPLTIAFAVLIAASALWAWPEQIVQTTLISMGGFSMLAFLYHFSHPDDRPYRHFHYLVCLASLGLILVHQARRTRALLRICGAKKPGGPEFNPGSLRAGVEAASSGRPRCVRGLTSWLRTLWTREIGTAILLSVLAFVGISALAAHLATTPIRFPLDKEKSPGNLGLDFEKVTLKARGDGLEIAGWFIPSSTKRRAIILVHGKDANRTREFDRDLNDKHPGEFPDLAVSLCRGGFSVLMIDLRGHGESGPSRFGFGLTERRDVLGAVDWLVDRGFSAGRIGVLGVSMGAAAVIGAAAEDNRIGAAVADSSYAEITSIIETQWSSTTHLPSILLLPTKWFAKQVFDCDLDSVRPVDEIGSIRRPILLIHGETDPLTPPEHARRLEEAAKPWAELWLVRSERHAGVYLDDPRAYVEKVSDFFNRSMK